MAAITETRRSGGLGCVFWLILLGLGAMILLSSIEVPGVGTVETRPHAVERHGSDAERVRSEISAGGGSHYDCKDGKEYVVKRLEDGHYALMVLRNGVEITSFITDQSYVSGRLEDDGCSNGWSHP